jgi:hypothetical protein
LAPADEVRVAVVTIVAVACVALVHGTARAVFTLADHAVYVSWAIHHAAGVFRQVLLDPKIEEKGGLLESVHPLFHVVDPPPRRDEHGYRLKSLLQGVVATVEPPGLNCFGHAPRTEGRHAA